MQSFGDVSMSSSQLKRFFFALQYCQYWYLIIAAPFFASETEMQSTLALVYSVIMTIETTVIIIGNSFAVFVFWGRIRFLKRAYFLLFNLAVTDLLVGLTELMNTACIDDHSTWQDCRNYKHLGKSFCPFLNLFVTQSPDYFPRTCFCYSLAFSSQSSKQFNIIFISSVLSQSGQLGLV